MPLDADFLQIAQRDFNPYLPMSGTEHMAYLLYSLARMTKPRVVIEYGSGYSTLFVLRALSDNMVDFKEEKQLLLEKSKKLLAHNLEGLQLTGSLEEWPRETRALVFSWLHSEDKAAVTNPGFYLNPYSPRLYSFEKLPPTHDYVASMLATIAELGHSNLFSYLHDQSFSADSLPAEVGYIDWAWNDDDRFEDFFTEFWPRLNPSGGLMIFHSVPTVPSFYDSVMWMRDQRNEMGGGDLELLILEEPHKLNQNGCAVLRRTSKYEPDFALRRKQLEILANIGTLINKAP